MTELKINILVKKDDSGFYYAVASVPGLKTFEACASRTRGKAIAYALTEIAVAASRLP